MSELTFGQKAVNLKFNPSMDDEVAKLKQQFADIIDTVNKLRRVGNYEEQRRFASVAITEIQTAEMWAVKALTWNTD